MIGSKLRDLRLKNKKTQEEIGNVLNLSNVAYGDYERNRTEPDIKTLKKLADYYSITMDELTSYDKNNSRSVLFTKDEVDKLVDVINMLNSKLK